MQINAFGFPLGTSTAGGNAAGAPALGFLQALGVAGGGRAVAPAGGPAVLPVTSLAAGGAQMADWNLADAAQSLTLPNGLVATMTVGGPAILPATTLPASSEPMLLPQTNDALAHVTAPAAMPAAPAAPATGNPILAGLQTSTSLSGLLATAARLPAEAVVPAAAPAALYSAKLAPAQPAMAQPAAAQLVTTQPAPTPPALAQPLPTGPVAPLTATAQPAMAQPAMAQPATAQPATAQPATAQPATALPATALPTLTQTAAKPNATPASSPTPIAAALTQAPAPGAPAAPLTGAAKPVEVSVPTDEEAVKAPSEDDGQPSVADPAQPLPDAVALPAQPQQAAAQPLPQQAAQPLPQQQLAEAQPAVAPAGTRQPRGAGVQAHAGDTPARSARKPATDEAALPGTGQKVAPDATGTDFARAVQATGTGGDAAFAQDNGQPRDPQVTLAAVTQPTPAAPATQNAAATPAMPAEQEPVVATRPGHFGQTMGVEIARKVEAGEETLRVRLSPDNLGRVEVTLAFEDGNLKATVRAESQRALDLLRQDMPDLARTLDQAGIRTDAQSFRFEARADTGGGQSASQQGGQQQRGSHPQQQQNAHADDLEPTPAYRAIRGDGQVDLLA